jgi:hypothetical protein
MESIQQMEYVALLLDGGAHRSKPMDLGGGDGLHAGDRCSVSARSIRHLRIGV